MEAAEKTVLSVLTGIKGCLPIVNMAYFIFV